MTERTYDQELRVNLSRTLDRLKPGHSVLISNDDLRELWPEQSEEELRALCNTNDLKHLVKLMASAHECDHEFNTRGDATFVKKN